MTDGRECSTVAQPETSRPSVSMPSEMLEEIEDRREKGTSRSEYIRDAVQARFQEEDAGTWDGPSTET